MNFLFDNYHERHNDRIIQNIELLTNIDKFINTGGTKLSLDNLFKDQEGHLTTDHKTMKQLVKIYKSFDYDPNNDSRERDYINNGISKILQILHLHNKKHNIEGKNMYHPTKLEKRKTAPSPTGLIVPFFYLELQVQLAGCRFLDKGDLQA